MAFLDLHRALFSGARWMLRPVASKLITVLQDQKDAVEERVQAAVLASYVESAPGDALDLIGAGRQLPRAKVRLEGDDSYRAWLRRPFERWHLGGTYAGLIQAIQHLGYPNVQIVTWRDLADAGQPQAFGGAEVGASFFAVSIQKPNPWGPGPAWADGSRWNSTPPIYWGGVSYEEAEEIRATIAHWKPAASSCRFVAGEVEAGRFVIWPCHESWERDVRSGAFREFYNHSFLKEIGP